jgi:hypothetical protein
LDRRPWSSVGGGPARPRIREGRGFTAS